MSNTEETPAPPRPPAKPKQPNWEWGFLKKNEPFRIVFLDGKTMKAKLVAMSQYDLVVETTLGSNGTKTYAKPGRRFRKAPEDAVLHGAQAQMLFGKLMGTEVNRTLNSRTSFSYRFGLSLCGLERGPSVFGKTRVLSNSVLPP